jgi:pimeloyl-ACP methyl ester carboxylesterase
VLAIASGQLAQFRDGIVGAMRRVAVVVVTVALAISACTASRGTATQPVALPAASAVTVTPSSGTAIVDGRAEPASSATDLVFHDLTKQLRSALTGSGSKAAQLSFSVGVMTVPLDWARAGDGRTVGLSVIRIRSSKQHDRIGSLVVNPGGPGVSGLEFALEAAADELPQAILDRFDIVGFDPRGVGLSSPISCIPDAQKDAELTEPADPASQAQWDAEVAESQRDANECYAKYGSSLTYYSTAETVRDLDALRAKLGDTKLTYLGYSYGTLLGAEYASAYPTRVRALVLDGAVDPTLSTTADSLAQAQGFQLAFNDYATACVKEKCELGPDPAGFLAKLESAADAHPIPSSDKADKRVAGSGAVQLAAVSALYDQTEWDTLTQALVDASKGDSAGVLSLDDQYTERNSDGTYDNVEDANDTIGCADTPDRPTVAQARALQPQWAKIAPFLGGSQAAGLYTCSLWKAPADPPIPITDQHAPTVLVVGTTNDPATPITGARHLTALLGTADLLVWQGDGHTAYPKTTCVTKAVNSYLVSLVAPAAGTTCPAS